MFLASQEAIVREEDFVEQDLAAMPGELFGRRARRHGKGALHLVVEQAQLGVHASQQLVACAAQEVAHLAHHRLVLLRADAAAARPQAAPQRVAQARAAVVCARGPARG